MYADGAPVSLKRPREEDEAPAPDPEAELRQQIISCGDKYSLAIKDVEALAKTIEDAYGQSRVTIARTFGHWYVFL